MSSGVKAASVWDLDFISWPTALWPNTSWLASTAPHLGQAPKPYVTKQSLTTFASYLKPFAWSPNWFSRGQSGPTSCPRIHIRLAAAADGPVDASWWLVKGEYSLLQPAVPLQRLASFYTQLWSVMRLASELCILHILFGSFSIEVANLSSTAWDLARNTSLFHVRLLPIHWNVVYRDSVTCIHMASCRLPLSPSKSPDGQ